MKRPVTLADVAERAGVSGSTVSRVLNRSKTQISISEETRRRVHQAAKDLGYRPHPAARALRGKGTNLLGLIVREIDDPFLGELIRVVRDRVKENGYDLVLGYARADPAEALALSEILDLRYYDGLFLVGDLQESPEDAACLAEIGTRHLMVSISRGSQQLVQQCVSVGVDNHKGALTALNYLAGLGHHRIAFIDGGGRLGDLRERLETYNEFMRDRFTTRPQEYVQSDENSYEGGYLAMKRLLSLSSPPTAVFAADDTMAIGALKAASDLQYTVPRDVWVVKRI